MRSAQLIKLSESGDRRAERRIVNLAARLREPGATLAGAVVHNLSPEGFLAETSMMLEVGDDVWLRLPGLAPQSSRVVWIEEGKAGFEFAAPLHPATLDMLAAAGRQPTIRRRFGLQ